MPDLDFLVHLPLLRIEEERLQFGAGQLYRMPFEHYDQLSLGAFSEQRRQYEATEPVFFALTVAISEDGLLPGADRAKGIAEIKMPTRNRATLNSLGLHAVNWFNDNFAEPAWTALLLAAPASGLVPPTWSQTFVAIDGDFCMPLASGPSQAARVQGEADHEYLFLPDVVSERIPTQYIERAANLINRIREFEEVPELHAALMTLRATGSPVLSRQDRLTMCVSALESLLLPEVRSGLTKTFATRCVALLAVDDSNAEAIESMASALYEARSVSMHGGKLRDDHAAVVGAYGEQMLAVAIRTIGAAVTGGETIEEIRGRLDRGYAGGSASRDSSLHDSPIGRAAEDRLARKEPSSEVYVMTSRMMMPEDLVGCWSPLIGLTTEGLAETDVMLVGEAPAPILMQLTPEELVDLEERDIRRDFLAQFGQQGHPMAVLMTVPDPPQLKRDMNTTTLLLERQRDLGVICLRIAGFDGFRDPALFGSAIFERRKRLRRPTVLRQTIAEGLRHKATQRIGPQDAAHLLPVWERLRCYDANRSPDIEHVLSLFRQSFNREFLRAEQRAVILLSVLEGMLGRFRRQSDPVQLEDLVAALGGDNKAVRWFRDEGRKFRNAVAHGRWRGEDVSDTLETLAELVTRIIPHLLDVWNNTAANTGVRPAKLLIDRATALHKGEAE